MYEAGCVKESAIIRDTKRTPPIRRVKPSRLLPPFFVLPFPFCFLFWASLFCASAKISRDLVKVSLAQCRVVQIVGLLEKTATLLKRQFGLSFTTPQQMFSAYPHQRNPEVGEVFGLAAQRRKRGQQSKVKRKNTQRK